MDRPANVVNRDSLGFEESKHDPRYGIKRKRLSSAAGGRALGCSLSELQPGKRSWPVHYHLANEEAIYVLEGSGTLRLGAEEIPVAAGDYVALPPGQAHAHQLVNSSIAVLRYLALSTMVHPDITVYPDSGKIGVFAGSAPGEGE